VVYGRFDSKIRFVNESDGRFDSRFDSNEKNDSQVTRYECHNIVFEAMKEVGMLTDIRINPDNLLSG